MGKILRLKKVTIAKIKKYKRVKQTEVWPAHTIGEIVLINHFQI